MSKTSETKTERVFRKKYGVDSFIEKTAIDKKYGFKSKTGKSFSGLPDFFREERDYCIVVEAKSTDHKLAVEEVQFYMKENSISQDIIGIAVSGQTLRAAKFSYFLKESKKKKIEKLVESEACQSLPEIKRLYRQKNMGILLVMKNY